MGGAVTGKFRCPSRFFKRLVFLTTQFHRLNFEKMKNNLSILASSLCLALLMIACTAKTPNPTVPDALKVAANETLKCTVTTKEEVQIYRCDSIAPGQYAWVFQAPEADLYNEKGEKWGNTPRGRPGRSMAVK